MTKPVHSEIHASNPALQSGYPLLVLDVRDGVSHPPRVGHHEMHWHEDVQFIVFVRGDATVDTPSMHYACRAGQAILFTPAALHRVVSSTGSTYTSFVFPAAVLSLIPGTGLSAEAVFARTDTSLQAVYHFDGSEPWHAEVVECLRRVRASALSKGDLSALRYRAIAYLCAAWSCYISHVSMRRPTEASIRSSERMRAALSFMREHFSEPIDTADVAAAAAVSESSLRRAFRETLRTTPHAYLQEMRIDRASELLVDPELSMTRIAAACGFADSSHFSHAFKKALGMTPSEYRAALLREAHKN
ncbi:helix-turn-helix domain-containing protein [Actinomyces oricola]